MKLIFASVAALGLAQAAIAGTVKVDVNNLPYQTENGQSGYNNCPGRADSPSAKCQTLFINSAEDFCLWAPATRTAVGNAERDVVSWCTKPGHGSRLIPKGALTGVHYIRTPHYIQISGTGDFTKMNIPAGDEGGELDPHGADGNGNPVGGIVIAKLGSGKTQIIEWNSFIAYNEFSIRACRPGPDAYKWCQHTYDVMGSQWNHPGNYEQGSFNSCFSDDVAQPPGLYKLKNGETSTWYQGVSPTPAGQKPAKHSNCVGSKTIAVGSYPTKRAKRSLEVESSSHDVEKRAGRHHAPGELVVDFDDASEE